MKEISLLLFSLVLVLNESNIASNCFFYEMYAGLDVFDEYFSDFKLHFCTQYRYDAKILP